MLVCTDDGESFSSSQLALYILLLSFITPHGSTYKMRLKTFKHEDKHRIQNVESNIQQLLQNLLKL